MSEKNRFHACLAASLCVFLLCVTSGNAEEVTSSEKPGQGRMVRLGEAEDAPQGYLVMPRGKGPFPAVVVIQEWWGLNDQIKGVADRLAAKGYVAVAPDLYHGKVATDPEEAHEIMRGLDQEQAVGELGTAMDYLRHLPEVGKQKIGSVGFCMGGGLSLRLALVREDLSGAVTFYGRPVTEPSELERAACPVLGLFGEEDQGIPREKVEAMATGLREAGKKVDVHFYEGAGHAFFNETRPSYRPEAARDAWKRVLSFFGEQLRP